MARRILFVLFDDEHTIELAREVGFPYEIPAERLDREIGEALLRISEERKLANQKPS